MLSGIIILLALVLAHSALTVLETALASHAKIKRAAEDGGWFKKILERDYTVALRVAAALLELAAGAFALGRFAGPLAQAMAAPPWAAAALTLLCVAYGDLLVGVLAPARFTAAAVHKGQGPPVPVVVLALAVVWVCTPFVKLLEVSAGLAADLFRVPREDAPAGLLEEEIRSLVDAGGDTGDIPEIQMIKNVFEFGDLTAGDVAIHRTDIVALSVDASGEETVRRVVEEHYTRFPVYQDNIDNIVGILHIKDMMKYILESDNPPILRALLRDPYFVPESKKADELFAEMQKNKVHMVVVVDEYGGTSGLVTMEDLIEEIMGNIFDEYDEEERPDIDRLDDTTFTVKGAADLEAVASFFEVDLPLEDYETVSGFVIGQLGRIPGEGEKPEVEFNGLLFKVNETEEKRISSILICKV